MISKSLKILLPAFGIVCAARVAPVQAGVTREDVAAAIADHVKAESKQAGGTFNVEDPAEKTKVALTLQKVHKSPLSRVGPDAYVACAEFSSTDAHMYDIDITMQGPDKDHLAFAEAAIHKKDGVARYSW